VKPQRVCFRLNAELLMELHAHGFENTQCLRCALGVDLHERATRCLVQRIEDQQPPCDSHLRLGRVPDNLPSVQDEVGLVPLLYDLAGFGQVGELLVLVARVANDEPEQTAVGAAVADMEGQATFRARNTAGLKDLPDAGRRSCAVKADDSGES
jgi:hypothetical protein